MLTLAAMLPTIACVPAQTLAQQAGPTRGVTSPQDSGPTEARPLPGDVDIVGSRVYVFVGKTGLGHDHAVIGRLQAGRIRLDAAEQAGTLVFDVRTFLADTADARKVLGLSGETDAETQKQVTANMLGPDVLDATRHPRAAFEVRSALRSPRNSASGNPLYDLSGAFTLKGATRPVVVPVEVETTAGLLRLRGGFSIRQTDFGMVPYKKFGGVVGVADELRIFGDIRIAAVRPPAAIPSTPPASAGGGLP